MSTRTLYGILSVGIIGVMFAGIAYNQGWFGAQNAIANSNGSVVDITAGAQDPLPEGNQRVKDAMQPSGDSAARDLGSARNNGSSPPEIHDKSVPGGFRLDENKAIASLVRDIQSGQAPAAQSSYILPEAFDKERYLADPDAYLKQIRPGRVFQSAQPGSDVKRIAAKSRALHRVLQGETTLLEVMVAPGMPVTFYTQQVGEFDNRLSTISVKADGDGVARAHFKATNAAGMVNIIAASPVHSEQVEFVVRVLVPEVVNN